MNDCLFCSIADHETPATFVRDEPDVLAIRDVNPQAPTHVLVLPREHIMSAAELTREQADLWSRMLAVAQEIARDEGLESGYRLVVNIGRQGGQTVSHLHVHLLGGRQMTWPPG
ncbi:MAG: histidine triad nucleotide-binding protein [Candidatus Dormibacteraeota bacterium]|nr:histidine triad nucleotide-binding protein [Candidatus Dormibacteraeota bacterium]